MYLDKPTRPKALTILLLVAALGAGFLVGSCLFPTATEPEPISRMSSGITHFDNLSTTDLTVTDDLTVADDLTADTLTAADLTLTDDLIVGDDATLQGITTLDDANLTVTTATITPTVTTYHADSAGAVTWTLPACSANGQLLLIYGDDANTITIADSSLRSADGNAVAIGQYDVALFVCMDTEWVQVSRTANQ